MALKIVWSRSIGFNIELNKMAKLRRPIPGISMKYTVVTDGADCYPWRETFIWWPWVTTVTGKRVWWKRVYKRRVWVVWGTGFHMEPEVQYATAFDLLTYQDQNLA
jgi:hypothetical protein